LILFDELNQREYFNDKLDIFGFVSISESLKLAVEILLVLIKSSVNGLQIDLFPIKAEQ